MKIIQQPLIMVGLGSTIPFQIPSNYLTEYSFITVFNPTDNSICIYPREVTVPSANACRMRILPYCAITIPILPEIQNGFNVIWSNDQSTQLTTPKNARIFISDENLNYNFSFAPSAEAGGSFISQVDVTDRAARLVGHVDVNSLPAIPAGANTIGAVDVTDRAARLVGHVSVDSLPNVTPIGWTWAKIIATGVGDQQVKGMPGKVAKIFVETSTVVCYLKDGMNQAWMSATGPLGQDFPLPLACLSMIAINFSAPGTAWILYQ